MYNYALLYIVSILNVRGSDEKLFNGMTINTINVLNQNFFCVGNLPIDNVDVSINGIRVDDKDSQFVIANYKIVRTKDNMYANYIMLKYRFSCHKKLDSIDFKVLLNQAGNTGNVFLADKLLLRWAAFLKDTNTDEIILYSEPIDNILNVIRQGKFSDNLVDSVFKNKIYSRMLNNNSTKGQKQFLNRIRNVNRKNERKENFLLSLANRKYPEFKGEINTLANYARIRRGIKIREPLVKFSIGYIEKNKSFISPVPLKSEDFILRPRHLNIH